MRIRHLKIKIKTLQAEAKIIRHEERKLRQRSDEERAFRRAARLYAKGKLRKEPVLKGRPQKEETKNRKTSERLDVRGHRQGIVREEARVSLLAYGFMRGTPYRAMEQRCHEYPDWEDVEATIRRFGGKVNMDQLMEWVDAQKPEIVPAPKPTPVQEVRAG